jgi:hypothetical protein
LTDFKLFSLPRITNRNRLLNHLELQEKRAFFPSNRSASNEINLVSFRSNSCATV